MGAAAISPELHGPEGRCDLLPLTLPVLVAPDDTMGILHFIHTSAVMSEVTGM